MGGVCGSCCGGGFWVIGELYGDSNLACARASLISFGAALNFFLNSLGGRICWVFGFWI